MRNKIYANGEDKNKVNGKLEIDENDWKRGGARNANRDYRKGKEFYVKDAMY